MHADLQDTLFHAPGRWTMYACTECNCGYLDPRPTAATLHLAYDTYYTHVGRLDDDPGRPVRGWRAALKQAILRAYIRRWFGAGRARMRDVLGLAMLLRPRLRAAFNAALRHLPRPAPGAVLLDVGCGSGRFMAWARQAGWMCEGTEIDVKAAEQARSRGFLVHGPDLQALIDSGRRYQAITISHVVEHVHQPLSLLLQARALLNDGGHFWIETPNVAAHGHAMFGRDWRGLEPPRHLQLFTQDALSALLERAGFSEVRVAPWQLDWVAVAPLSREIARARPPRGVLWRVLGERHERVGRHDSRKREFITLIATVRPSATVHGR